MSFKKYHPQLKENLQKLDITDPNAFQKKILPLIKGGSSVFGIGPKSVGKTTSLIISVIQKLKAEAFEDSPRALIIVKDKQAVIDLKLAFEEFTKRTDLRIYTAYEGYDIEKQREEIYYGVDILIATPNRLNKLYFMNSVHLREIQIFALDDAEFLIRNNYNNDILRVTESIPKCQYVILAEDMHQKLEKLKNSFMFNARTVSVE